MRAEEAADATSGAAKEGKTQPSLLRNVLSNWVNLGSAVVYSLVITPIVIRALDREAYGIWSFLNGFVAYSQLFYLGLGTALIKYAAQYYAVGDRSALNRLISVVFTAYVGIGMAALAVGVVVSPYVPGLLLTDSSTTPATTVIVTVIVLAGRLGLLFVGSVFGGVLVAQGRMDLHRTILVSGHVVRLLVVPLAVRASDPLLALALTVAVTGAIEVAAMFAIARKQDRDLRCRLVLPKSGELRLLYGFGFLAFLLQVADRLISYSDTTVIGVILGAESVALYAPPLALTEYGRIVIFGIASVLLPHLSALHATGRNADFRFVYQRVLKMTSLVAVFVSATVVALGQDFLRLWVGSAFSDPALPVLVALAIASLAQAVAVQSQTPFCLALGRVRFAALVLIVEGITNLVLSVVLARRFGNAGVAVATAIPAVLVSGTFLPVYVARQVGAPLRGILRHVVLPVVVFAAVVSAGHLAVRLTIPGDSYLLLMAKFLVGSAIAAVAGWLVIADSERRFVRALLERQRRRLVAVRRQPDRNGDLR